MKQRGLKREVLGVVVGNKADKTVAVVVDRLVKHRFYHKYMKRRTKLYAHDQNNDCGVGDRVLIRESRPLSKTKRWRVSRILEKAI